MVSLNLKPFDVLEGIVVALKRLLRLNKMTMFVAARMPNGLGFRAFRSFPFLKRITVREFQFGSTVCLSGSNKV